MMKTAEKRIAATYGSESQEFFFTLKKFRHSQFLVTILNLVIFLLHANLNVMITFSRMTQFSHTIAADQELDSIEN